MSTDSYAALAECIKTLCSKMWKDNMLKFVTYEKLLARINNDMDTFNESWGQIFGTS